MISDCGINEYCFPEAKSIVVSGDIHGDFNILINKVCVQYQMQDTLIIVAGDCGFGFENKGFYDNIVKRNAKRMNEANNWIVFVRGNHDNPAYFDGKAFLHKRFMAVPDYSIVKACDKAILCIGGAISIDRKYRMNAWEEYVKKHRGHTDDGALAKNVYWTDEAPMLNMDKLRQIKDTYKLNAVVSHTAPSFCELQNKNGLCCYAYNDDNLIYDVNNERLVMDEIHNILKGQNQPITHWCYGHFHQSHHTFIDGIMFKMLDIMELCQIGY